MKKILIISHEATQTGAPILLLHILKALAGNYNFTIVLKRGGPLEPHFAAVGKVYLLKDSSYNTPVSAIRKIGGRLRYLLQLFQLVPVFWQTDYVFSNTITNGRLLHLFGFLRKKTAVFVHELAQSLHYYAQAGDTARSLQTAEVVFYPGRVVKEALLNAAPYCASKLQHLPYYFPSNDFSFSAAQKVQARNQWRLTHQIPENAKILVGMGTVSARKGTGQFVATALEVLKKRTDIYFVWIGGWSQEKEASDLRRNLESGVYPMQLSFTGALPYHPHLLLPFDLFFLSSVEDAYPLVVIEAAYMQVPAACYHSSGGIVELLENEGGFILISSDPQMAAQELLSIIEDETAMARRAAVCNNRVHLLHSDTAGLLKNFENLVK